MPKKTDNLDNIRHSLAHLLAAAVLKKYPDAKLGIGPVIESGFYYDFLFPKPVSPEDLKEFERSMREMARAGLDFKGRKVTLPETKKLFKGQPFKLDLVKEFAKEKAPLSVYETVSPKAKGAEPRVYFLDLCRGGHVKNTKDIDPDSFKLSHLAGAYWRGDEKNPQLTRIYGLAFNNKNELEAYVKMQEEAQKRDHRVLGERLGIFTFAEEVGQGLPLWLPHGTIVRDELEKWARETESARGYQRVATPHITKEELYKISGHLPFYAEDMYSPIDIEGAKYYLKPMNCPHHHMIYRSRGRSYRELPLRLTEYGQLYRFEMSGALHGLMRVRGFCQNDAHIYVAEKDVVAEFARVMDLHKYYYGKLGIKNFRVKLGLRDPKNLRKKYHGDDAMWRKAEKLTRAGLEQSGVEFEEDLGGAAHYGPKGDIIIQSVIGKEYAIGTVQVDLFMPQRFGLKFANEKGREETPAIIHRAPLGSHERMVGFLLEHFAGAFPVWLSPVQAAVLPVGDKFAKYAEDVNRELQSAGIRSELSEATESLGKRIREAEMQKIPYILVVGEKEEKNGTVNVRHYRRGQEGEVSVKKLSENISREIKDKVI